MLMFDKQTNRHRGELFSIITKASFFFFVVVVIFSLVFAFSKTECENVSKRDDDEES